MPLTCRVRVHEITWALIRMFKKRNISVYNDLKTSFFYKLSLFLGLFLLFVFVFFKVSSLFISQEDTGFLQLIYDFSQSSYVDSIIAFSIIFLGIGIILYFFHCQFAKLARIANEIENEEEFEGSDWKIFIFHVFFVFAGMFL